MNKTNNLDKQTIPKIIYFCWFGNNPKPELFWKCFHSWKKYCPDYKIIEWNEKNFDLRSCLYAQEAYDAKKNMRMLQIMQDYGSFTIMAVSI